MKHILRLIGMAAVAGLIFLVMIFGEINGVLSEKIVPSADMDLEAWLENFRLWGSIGIYSSLAACLLWYLLGQWFFKVNNWKESGKRPIWYLLILIPFTAFVLSCVFTSQTQEGAWLAYLFYFLNNHLTYYLGTTFFSPSSFKYTPLGASKLRRRRLAF